MGGRERGGGEKEREGEERRSGSWMHIHTCVRAGVCTCKGKMRGAFGTPEQRDALPDAEGGTKRRPVRPPENR